MTRKPIEYTCFPAAIQPFTEGATLYDNSCSTEARVIFADKDNGYFIKSAPKGVLGHEAAMTRYFHAKGLSAQVLSYVSAEQDWLVTEKICGDDCTAAKYREQPERLCDAIAERLALLHSLPYEGCPINRTECYLATVKKNYQAGRHNASLFPDNWGYASADEAWRMVEADGHLLKADTLLHGDYCLPNIILNDWTFSGFIDLGSGGIGDRHVDVFWGAWTLNFNLKTDKYRQRFIDAYGRNRVNKDMLRLIAACEVFG